VLRVLEANRAITKSGLLFTCSAEKVNAGRHVGPAFWCWVSWEELVAIQAQMNKEI
jgi:hypothetical protein